MPAPGIWDQCDLRLSVPTNPNPNPSPGARVTRMLEQKLTEAKSKKDTLKARAKSAAASRQINDMIQGLNTSNALTAFEKMEEKVMALEAESEATLQVCIAAAMLVSAQCL